MNLYYFSSAIIKILLSLDTCFVCPMFGFRLALLFKLYYLNIQQ
jgi:hypothetical protein